jgi:hypothetical protein
VGDWLGTGAVHGSQRQYWSFGKARAFVHDLGLKSQTDWWNFCQSGDKPIEIPSNPQQKYANDGWTGYGDWLGTGAIASRLREYRSFEEARAFVRGLKLKSRARWVAMLSRSEAD